MTFILTTDNFSKSAHHNIHISYNSFKTVTYLPLIYKKESIWTQLGPHNFMIWDVSVPEMWIFFNDNSQINWKSIIWA